MASASKAKGSAAEAAAAAHGGWAGSGLAALGIVYGDLGTSPLYTLQTVVGAVGGTLTGEVALDSLSLIVWALIVTVSLKYCVFVMRADNHGEGGILALMSLIGVNRATGSALVAAGLFGAALIYGDGILTPAISVLSALEGINVATSVFKPFVMPGAVVILVALFAAQTLGTARIGKVFGPVMLLWFASISLIGVVNIVQRPDVLLALDPRHAIGFLASHGRGSLVVLGGVFLAITGGEALYADMGHVGRNPIRVSWYAVVLPALLLSYAGQTALLLAHPDLEGNPFFKAAPGWAIYPLVLLATLATIIASQAIITGSFSLTRQAIQLGWLPGLNIRQTSDREYGQIYVPLVNWILMACTVALTIIFGSSDRLAGAYGTAVSTTMLLTTILLYNAMRGRWHWPVPVAMLIAAAFIVVDLAFFAANLLKIREGGWIPLLFGAGIFLVMTTWRRGIEAIRAQLALPEAAGTAVLRQLADGSVPRVPGTAVFLSRMDDTVPALMVRHVAQFGAMQKVVLSLAVAFEEVPRVPQAERFAVTQVAGSVWHGTVRFGFMEVPNLPEALSGAQEAGCPVDLDQAVYFGGHDEMVRSDRHPRLAPWRRLLFGFLFRNAVRPADRFDVPAGQFVEVGRRIGV